MKRLVLGVCLGAALLVGIELVFRAFEPPSRDVSGPRVSLPAKAPGSFRIVAVGGSTVYGEPHPPYGIVAQLDAALKLMHPRRTFEVINLGRNGKSSNYVRRAVEAAAPQDVDLLLVLTGHNEFLNRSTEKLSRAERFHRSLQELAFFRALDRWTGHPSSPASSLPKPKGPRTRADVMPARLEPPDRDGVWFAERLERYAENLEAIARAADAHAVPLMLGTLPCNLSDWAPVHHDIGWSRPHPDYEGRIAEMQTWLAAGNLDALLTRLDADDSTYGEDAMWLYLRAQRHAALGEAQQARALQLRARDLDPIPTRVLGAFQDMARDTAARHGTLLVDLEAAFAAAARPGPGNVGLKLIVDNVHPTPLGAAVAVEAIIGLMGGVLADAGPDFAAGRPLESPDAWVTRYLQRFGDAETRRKNWVGWHFKNAVYCMKTPFYNWDAARHYLEQAEALAPDDWKVAANLGVVDLFAGRRQAGLDGLARARELKGARLDPSDRGSHPYLREALEDHDLSPEDI